MAIEVSPYPIEQINALTDLDFLPLVPMRYRGPLLQGVGAGAFRCLLAKCGEKSAGVTLATVSPRTKRGRLLAVYVAPEFRRSGVASRLLAQMELLAYWAGCDAMVMECLPDHSSTSAATAMLKAQGWEDPTAGVAAWTKSLSHLQAIAGIRDVPQGAGNERVRQLPKAFQLIHRCAEKLISEFSRDGKRDFFPPESFPWAGALASEWKSIRAELDEVMKERERIPNVADVTRHEGNLAIGGQWKTFFFLASGYRAEANCQRCPQTARLLKNVPGLRTAMFSILAPGHHLPAHRGYYNGLLRCHLGLLIPDPACRIRVGPEVRHWQEGQILIFDDTHFHEVWNDSGYHRVVLLLDFERPLHFPLSLLNRLVIWLFFRTSYSAELAERFRGAEQANPLD